MKLDAPPFVGNEAARRVHGYSAGADTLLLGRGDERPEVHDLRETLDEFAPARVRRVDAAASGWLSLVAELLREGSDTSASDSPPGDSPAGDSWAGRSPAIVVADGLRISPVALLDLLDRPGDPTAVATIEATSVVGPAREMTRLRTERDLWEVHSVGTSAHAVSSPTALAPGVLRIAASRRAAASDILEAAAQAASAQDATIDPFDLVLLALVRGGLGVAAIPLGPFTVERAGTLSQGAPGSPWQQRLAGASRGGDGLFSTKVIRPISRRVTRFGLRHGWAPNVVTVTSLGLGLLAAGLAAVDNRWTWVAAAVLLQAALVVDCVDGEIARFSRRFSAFGAWLDAVGDRVKEYSILAAVASVAVRRDDEAWLLAITTMVLVTARHLEDYAYVRRSRTAKSALGADILPVDDPRDLGAEDADLEFLPPADRRARAIFWAKKVLHLPIAERYLLLSLGLLTFEPAAVLWLLAAAVAIALVWTQGGRTAKALLGRDSYRRDPLLGPTRWGHLDYQTDLGPLAMGAGRILMASFRAAVLGIPLTLAAAVLLWRGPTAVALPVALVGLLLTGVGCRPALQHPLGWQAPALLWVAEAAIALAAASGLAERQRWVAFAYLAAVAWHRYDVVYRLRDTGQPPPRWITAVTLGVDGRILLLVLVAWLAPPAVPWLLGLGALALITVYAVESARAWRAWAAAQAQAHVQLLGVPG